MITKSYQMSGEKTMGLYKRPNSNVWQMSFFVNGVKVRKSTKTSIKRAAQRIYEKAKAQSLEGKYVTNDNSKMPFDQLVNEFLEKHCKTERSSFKNDISTGKRLTAYFKQTPIEKITSYDIKTWRSRRKDHITSRGTPISKSALNSELSFLKMMFSLAVDWGWLTESPVQSIKRLKGEVKRMRFLNREEINRLIAYCTPHFKPVLITAVSTGMRIGEILSLKWKDIDFENGFIRVEKSKNKERRDIPVEDHLLETLECLSEVKQHNRYVFMREYNLKVTYDFVIYHFHMARKKAGIEDFRIHDLRHTAASLYATGGCDIMSLKNLLGHKTIEMTQRYAHLMPDAHDRTRRIMNDFWKSSKGDTKNDTPEIGQAENKPEKLDNPTF
jgi:integrase